MKLIIVTPLSVALDKADIRAITAEDATGRFGILPGHADFLTDLAISVVSWTLTDGTRRHAAVRGGVLAVTGGDQVHLSTREAVLGDDLATLCEQVLTRFRAEQDEARAEHVDATRLQLAAIRQIVMNLDGRAQRDSLA